jgi:hypothetical protein
VDVDEGLHHGVHTFCVAGGEQVQQHSARERDSESGVRPGRRFRRGLTSNTPAPPSR